MQISEISAAGSRGWLYCDSRDGVSGGRTGAGELQSGALGFFGGWGPRSKGGSRGLEAAGRGV